MVKDHWGFWLRMAPLPEKCYYNEGKPKLYSVTRCIFEAHPVIVSELNIKQINTTNNVN